MTEWWTDRELVQEHLERYVVERADALLSLDAERIRAWLKRWGEGWGDAPGFWTRVHTLRASRIVGLSDEARRVSQRWLADGIPLLRG